MAVYKQKESKFWWYKFTWNGEPIRKSTKQTNKRVAEQMQAAHKTVLAKGEVGIVKREPAPTLKQFSERFMQAVSVRCAEKPRTIEFYQEKLNRLLEFPHVANAALDAIDEALIEQYVQERRKQVAPATVNRQLATLRRALRLAHEWKVIDRSENPPPAGRADARIRFQPRAGTRLPEGRATAPQGSGAFDARHRLAGR